MSEFNSNYQRQCLRTGTLNQQSYVFAYNAQTLEPSPRRFTSIGIRARRPLHVLLSYVFNFLLTWVRTQAHQDSWLFRFQIDLRLGGACALNTFFPLASRHVQALQKKSGTRTVISASLLTDVRAGLCSGLLSICWSFEIVIH